VSLENVKQIIHETTTGTRYSREKLALSEEFESFDVLKRFKVKLLPCDANEVFVKKLTKFSDQFDVVYLSAAMSHRIPDSVKVLKSNGRLIVESAKYLLDLSKEQCHAFYEKVHELAKEECLKKSAEETKDADYFIFLK
jgi:dynein assembly factor 3